MSDQAQIEALPLEGYVRLKQFLGPNLAIPLSRSTWFAGVKSGRFPKGEKPFGGNITVWDVRKIRALLNASNSEVA
ncbi:Uncharacterised protein [Burkholderia pseudomallei]|nr:Uncharacterised protein [Burkholderia pseudomallei]